MKKILRTHPYLFALLLLTVLVIINVILQPNFFSLRVLSGNLRVWLPLMLLAAGQTLVIIGGGIDLSVGTMVSLINAVLVTLVLPETGLAGTVLALFISLAVGTAAGMLNGFFVSLLRLQPIVTTYATSFVFSGLALLVLPRPGGQLPRVLTSLYRSSPLGIPFALFVIAAIILIWLLLKRSRFGQYLYAIGSNADAAYTSGLAVSRLRFSFYALSGLCSALAAWMLTMSMGSGNPRSGDAMTLDSIVAVVLGGTRLSGGQGGAVGSILGVAILGMIRNIISFANVPTWYQTLFNAIIIVLALAGPGVVRLLRRPE